MRRLKPKIDAAMNRVRDDLHWDERIILYYPVAERLRLDHDELGPDEDMRWNLVISVEADAGAGVGR